MVECIRCGVSDEKEMLFDAISSKGLVKICKKCNEVEEFPLIGKDYLDRPEKVKTVYERLSSMAHLDPEKHKGRIIEREEALKRQRQNKTLKDIVDENFAKKVSINSEQRTDLIENFHWAIKMARRSKKISQKQLAEYIGESEIAIRMAEEGHIVNTSDTLVKKLEDYFKIKLFKEGFGLSLEDLNKQKLKEDFEKDAKFNEETTNALTISDLQNMTKKKEKGIFSFFKRKKKDENKKESSEDEQEITKEETDEILFGENDK
ncbi:MAG TPA: helix-turn-helix domain-containing protein [Candidatus Pacearchaeota archaeon]|nr:helix-turn-helix domain-containing protein [Candidatus Pacearchaeota archaeon]